MARWWVSWWTGYYASEGCTEPPFQVWDSGHRYRNGRDEMSLCAVIDAPGADVVREAVQRHFPDAEMRFCNLRLDDWTPGDRFADFRGRTRAERD